MYPLYIWIPFLSGPGRALKKELTHVTIMMPFDRPCTYVLVKLSCPKATYFLLTILLMIMSVEIPYYWCHKNIRTGRVFRCRCQK